MMLRKLNTAGWIFSLAGIIFVVAIIVISVRSCSSSDGGGKRAGSEELAVPEVKLRYGIEYEKYSLVEDVVGNGETLSHILGRYGVGPVDIDKIVNASKNTSFNLRNMRAGNSYTIFLQEDSTSLEPVWFVYEKSITDYVVVSLKDSIYLYEGAKDMTVMRRKETADIESSLWNCMVDHKLHPALSCEMEDIFGWSVDFFSLQNGDTFTVIFDEKYIDTTRVGVGRVYGAVFHHNGKDYYAIPFVQDGKVVYWDENGNSLRKQLLKAPLKYSRISSRFSNSRLHPVLKIRRPHHGVDYAAPSGTPVVAIADGTVISRGWDSKGGGNTLKIRHANNLTSGYLHLKGFAKGIATGKHVSQGDVIGYVGTTGVSTGPHLDFRLWKGGTAIDPLKAPSNPIEPIAQQNKERFNAIRDRIMAELRGEVPDSVQIHDTDLGLAVK